jgi:uncharacterized protein (TIGR00266 family)
MSDSYYDHQPGERLDLPSPEVSDEGEGPSGLRYRIMGTTLQALTLELPPGQEIFSEGGGMGWMSGNVQMQTNMQGGLFGGLKRMFSGESLFVVTFQSQGGTGVVGFTAELPGKIIPVYLGNGQSIICQRDSFVCAESSVEISIHFNRKLGAGFFGGEGFILQKVTGPGLAFFNLDGEIVEYTLQPGEMYKVDTGYVGMMEPTVDFDIEMVRGFKNVLFGGEGLFLTTVRGPGRVWLQTMPALKLAQKIGQYLPGREGGGGSGFNINIGGD